MAWETRRNKQYYYRKRRQGKRVISEYVGAGEQADLIAQVDAIAMQVRQDQARAERQARDEIESCEQDIRRLADFLEAITQAVLIASGYHTHKREWRRSRGTRTDN